MGCNITVHNNWTQIHTKDREFPFTMLDNALSFYIDGYERTKEYKENKWDGKRHLIYQKPYGYSLRTGLLNKVLLILDVSNYPYTLLDKQTFITPVKADYQWNFKKPLWEHQTLAEQTALEKKSGIIEIGMGGGKTVLMAKIIHAIKNSTNCFCERSIIAHQNERVFIEILGRCGFIGDNIFRPDKLNVIMLQTAYNAYIHTITANKNEKEHNVLPANAQIYRKELKKVREDKKTVEKIVYHIFREGTEFDTATYKIIRSIIETANVTFWDESHHIAADTYYFVSQRINSKFNFGVSATPYRMHGDDLVIESGIGQKIVRFPIKYLINHDILLRFDVDLVMLPYMYFSQDATFPQVYREGIVANEVRNKMVIEKSIKLIEDGRIGIISIYQVNHGQRLTTVLQDKGIKAEFLYGNTPTIVRDEAIHKLRTRNLDVLVSNLLGEGFDLPELEFLTFAKGLGKDQPDKLSIMVTQESGRLIRKFPNKRKPILVDFIDRAKYLFDHFKARARTYKSFGCELNLPVGIHI